MYARGTRGDVHEFVKVEYAWLAAFPSCEKDNVQLQALPLNCLCFEGGRLHSERGLATQAERKGEQEAPI